MARIGAVISWMLVVASIVLWGMHVAGLPTKPQPVIQTLPPAVSADLGPLLGRTAPVNAPSAVAPELAARFRLVGVMAPPGTAMGAKGTTGVALLAIDGKPPRAYRVGAKLDRELMLLTVGHRTATIATMQGEPRLKLELPPNETSLVVMAPAAARVTEPALPRARLPHIPDLEDAERQMPQPGDPIAPPSPPGPDPQQQAISGNPQ